MTNKIAVGSHILIGLGCIAKYSLARKIKNYEWLFKEKSKLVGILRDLKSYQWDALNYCEETVWKPKYRELLRRTSRIK